MSLRSRILGKFYRDEKGIITVEAVIIVPIILFLLFALVVYFDGFRQKGVNLRAAYTVSDLLSRQYPTVDEDYVDGLKSIYDYLVDSPDDSSFRVSMVQFDSEDLNNDDDGFAFLKWSHGIGEYNDLTDSTLDDIRDRIPLMAHGDSLLILETKMTYTPNFSSGIVPFDIEYLIATRPRFIPPCWEDCTSGG